MKRHVILRLLVALLVMVFVGAFVQLIHIVHAQNSEQEEFSELQDLIVSPVVEPEETQSPTEKSADSKQEKKKKAKKKKEQEVPSYEALHEKNPDFIGWITIENTPINYPVMYTPDDEEYYLHRSFDKKYSYSGVPFLGRGSDLAGSNILIYGHHMKNGTMFAELTKYAEKKFREEHSEILFDTLEERRTYEVIAAFPTTVASDETFRYYEYTGFLELPEWTQFIVELQARDAQMPKDIPYGERLLTLSTCAYHKKEGRFVVVARQI